MSRPAMRASLGILMVSLAGVTCAGAGDAQDPAAQRRALEQALFRGDAEAVERTLSGRTPDAETAFYLGEAAALRGNLGRADSLFAAAAAAPSPLRTRASARRAEVLVARGNLREALGAADGLAVALERSESNTAGDWLALGIAYRILGREQPDQFKDALVALDNAVEADSTLVEAHLRLGELFLEKYQAPDAKKSFAEALRRDPGNARAQLGLAMVAQFEGAPHRELFEQAAKAGPGLADAEAWLARLDLDTESFAAAAGLAGKAIALDSANLSAWAVLATAALLTGDSAGSRAAEAGVLRHNRAPAAFYAAMAEAMARQRRYAEAARLAARGVAADGRDPAALTALGTNELRLGAIDSGRAHLERAFARDPYHVWNKNTLDLLDELAKYRTVRSGRFEFVAAPAEVDLLTLYLAPLLERAFDSLSARYRYSPPTPVRLEIYRRHADFSVRTVGLAGIGALGVSFGSTLAMDAPSARPVGEFNWASTAWHELTHAFTLGATDHKIPRWFSEGLSVLEERRARQGWGAQASTAWVAALKGNRLNPLSRFNDGFVRPRHPADVSFAYYQASLLCEYLESAFGFESITKMLAAYRRGMGTEAAFRDGTGLPMDELDKRFSAWLMGRFATPLQSVGTFGDSTATPGELQALMITAGGFMKTGQIDQAIAALEKADKMFPDMADDDSPAWALARLYKDKGDDARALEYLSRVTRYNESQYEANRLEAELRTAKGDAAGAFAALERAIYISPYDPAVHAAAAVAAAAAGNQAAAVRERRAVLALDPSDQAGAHYELAVALRDAGNPAEARREVLKALELAPSFEKAQSLLLELRGGN
ncbi:MAG: tetratricopeptide repeat protein [Gemmatimonadales bacterium]